jgi:predicted dithiol-disulfide oxidoreductase (DUF899 family)
MTSLPAIVSLAEWDAARERLLAPVWTLLDLTPLGRQEEWEDSPDGRQQGPAYAWWRRHDEYDEDNEEVAR